jgi:hypothetical protein
MSRMKRSRVATRALTHARRAAAQLRPAVAHVKPLASSAGAAAGRRIHRTRAWAAPHVDRTGQILQESVAPRVSALLSSAARRLEPAEPKRRHWHKMAVSSAFTAGASAVAAIALKRRKADVTASADEADADDAKRRDEQARTSTEADA